MFPTTPRKEKGGTPQKKKEVDNEETSNHVKDKILEWEARAKNYKEKKKGKDKKGKKSPEKVDEKNKEPKEFKEGDFVLLRDHNAKEPPDKPSRWWYGPFTIRSISDKGKATLNSVRGGEVVASIDRLKHHPANNYDYVYQGYTLIRDDEVT